MKKKLKDAKGFTLIELMVAIAIFSIVMAAMVSMYSLQLKSHITQQDIVDMHQNARAAMMMMQNEIRRAGINPTGALNIGINIATPAQIQFTMDIDGNGNVGGGNENIIYDLTGTTLGRNTGGGSQPVAQNIEALNFVYLDDRINDGVDDDGDGIIDEPDEAVMATPVSGTARDDIKMIQITIVARSGQNVSVHSFKHTDNNIYFNQQGQVILPAQNDQFRRTLLTSNIYLRNSGV